jgi:uncharacterized protein YndB with AHSA1/START domain
MTHIEHTVTIARPVEDVWAFLADARNDPKWMTHVIEVGRGGDQPLQHGVEIDEVVKFYGVRMNVTLVVTEHEPPSRSAIDVRGPVKGRGTYRLEPCDGGTRFTMSVDTDAHGFLRLAEPVFARMARRDVATNAEHLKDLLEANGTP